MAMEASLLRSLRKRYGPSAARRRRNTRLRKVGADQTVSTASWDRRLRDAARILETELPTPANSEIAARVGLSEYHFTRLFTAQAGRSPHGYANDLRLRGAAGRLRYTDDPVPAIARDFAWASQATFTRAFSDHFGEPPARFRRRVRAELASAATEAKDRPADVRLALFRPQPLFARRYLGARHLAPAQWADFLARLPPELLGAARSGLLYDDPRETAPEAIRYDCAVHVGADARLPPELAEQGFERLVAPGGEWACADAVGHEAVPLAYRRIVAQWLPTRPDRTLEGDPHLERFLVTPEDPARPPVLAVCLRVRHPAEPARPGMADSFAYALR